MNTLWNTDKNCVVIAVSLNMVGEIIGLVKGNGDKISEIDPNKTP